MKSPSQLIHFLGTGHGNACGNRYHTAILVKTIAGYTLFDCGEPVCHLLKKNGIDFNSIERLVISHLHGDHVGGFHMLIQGMWLERRKRPLPIYLPEEGVVPLQEILKMGYLDESLIGFKIHWHILKVGVPIQGDNIEAIPYPSTHLDVLKQLLQKKLKKQFQAFCFDVNLRKFHLGMSMDLGAPEDIAPLFSQPVDLLVCELAHFEPEALFSYLKGKPFKKLVLTHIAEEFYNIRPKILKMAEKYLGKNKVKFAEDDMKITLG
ncbi:MAG: MBL fold metallo-hydrolase [Verrucomicrobiota bacterium]|nr:MBL fold metallo-hydrolase [Verrucomicrobiota bacterium]